MKIVIHEYGEYDVDNQKSLKTGLHRYIYRYT